MLSAGCRGDTGTVRCFLRGLDLLWVHITQSLSRLEQGCRNLEKDKFLELGAHSHCLRDLRLQECSRTCDSEDSRSFVIQCVFFGDSLRRTVLENHTWIYKSRKNVDGPAMWSRHWRSHIDAQPLVLMFTILCPQWKEKKESQKSKKMNSSSLSCAQLLFVITPVLSRGEFTLKGGREGRDKHMRERQTGREREREKNRKKERQGDLLNKHFFNNKKKYSCQKKIPS